MPNCGLKLSSDVLCCVNSSSQRRCILKFLRVTSSVAEAEYAIHQELTTTVYIIIPRTLLHTTPVKRSVIITRLPYA